VKIYRVPIEPELLMDTCMCAKCENVWIIAASDINVCEDSGL
jgi:hypothetical protein